ncbi:MAG: GyrI-like domain-containing protein [Erysipelotrichaceae bacterium]
MEFKIVDKPSFKLIGKARSFNSATSYSEIPAFWQEFFSCGDNVHVCGTFGVCIENQLDNTTFQYLIADCYDQNREYPDEFEVYEILENSWAIFPCVGPLPKSLQCVNTAIFNDWIPNCNEYSLAGGYNIEYYSNPNDYTKGTEDNDYYCEIWIPVVKNRA